MKVEIKNKGRKTWGGWGSAGYQPKRVVLKCDHCGILFSRMRSAQKAHDDTGSKKDFCTRVCFRASQATVHP